MKRVNLLVAFFALGLTLGSGVAAAAQQELRPTKRSADTRKTNSLQINSAEATPEDAAALVAVGVLEKKGLRKIGTRFSLQGDVDINRQLREIEQLGKKLREAQREMAICEARKEKKRQMILGFIQQRMNLRARLSSAGSVQMHNQVVTTINELGDRIVLLQTDDSDAKALDAAHKVVETLQAEYVQMVLDTRKLYNELHRDYINLRVDMQVVQAVAAVNKTSEKPLDMGPSRSFEAAEKKLKKIEETVLVDTIPLRKGGGSLWFVTVVFNEGKAQTLAIDTGASIISLPWDVAMAAGLSPERDDETMSVSMADGSVVKATRKFAKTVRVGKFVAENVECVVMPREMQDAAPLLGLSFFKNFTFKIDSANAKLMMSQVGSLEKTKPVKKTTPSRMRTLRKQMN